jgi:methionyl-tRNA synthetase
VSHYWQLLKDKNYIKEGGHTGYYSVNEESFIAEKDLIKGEKGELKTEAGETVEFIKEKNYIFEIDEKLRQAIKEWASASGSIVPDSIKNKIV